MQCYYNDEYFEENSLNISIKAPSFQYGYGVFTSLRTKQAKAILLAQHLERLRYSCNFIGILFPARDYQAIISELVTRNNHQTLRLKIIIFEETNNQVSLLITASEFIPNTSPKRLIVISQNYGPSLLREIKSLNYIENVLLHRRAINAGYDEGLLVNSQGIICECCYANIFFVKQGEIYTPKANGNILNGIIRQELIRTFPIIEKDILLTDLPSFEQVFISNSVQGIAYVKQIDNYNYNSRPITELAEWENSLGFSLIR